MNKKIIVLGAGMVGRAIAYDLSRDYDVTSVDYNNENLNWLKNKCTHIQTIQQDLSHLSKLKEIVVGYDLVLGAVPGFMGYSVLKTLIEANKNVVDISFFPEDMFELDELAKQHGVTVVTDCGVAPGMSNFILGYYDSQMDVKEFECFVGGLPVVREWPYEYKAPFSPIDVLEEYTRPARYIENGHLVTRLALSDSELINFPEIGTLEAFNTDGLRSLLKTMPKIPNMKEKTLRYPGHIRYIQALKDGGFLSNEPIAIGNANIRPMDFTSKILFKKWKLQPNEAEFTIMKIRIVGEYKGEKREVIYSLLDRYDASTELSSMARTTGFAATAVANLILSGKFQQKGICPPEFVGKKQECFDFVMKYFQERNIFYKK